MTLDLSNVPLCPTCGFLPFRKAHVVKLMIRSSFQEGEFCVCMHCSGIWKFKAGHWIAPADAELEALMPQLGPVALKFRINRALGVYDALDWEPDEAHFGCQSSRAMN